MSATAIFPLEIAETIIDLLAEDDLKHSTLKMCSLVCQAFVPRCRKHIFASIVLNDPNYAPHSRTTDAFERLLSERPGFADYIRKLDYSIRVVDLISPSIQESLKRISRLEFLTIRYNHSTTATVLDWSNNPIRPALLHLLHLPSLTHFEVYPWISNFVVSDLIPCVNLKHLDIGHLRTGATETPFPAALPGHPIQLNEFVAGFRSATAIVKLCTTRRPDGQFLIDFRSLSKIKVFLEQPDDIQALQELFKRCEILTDVDISLWDRRRIRPNLADMLRPSMQSLKHIVLHLLVHNADEDPLFGIPSELEAMRTKNVIESVTIKVLVRTDEDCSGGDDWGRLDEVLTSSGWFALKRVSLAIEITDLTMDNNVEVAIRKLPETQFQRLSTSESVSFDFEVNFVWVSDWMSIIYI